MIFNKWIGRCMSCGPKIPCGSPTVSEIVSSTSIKTS